MWNDPVCCSIGRSESSEIVAGPNGMAQRQDGHAVADIRASLGNGRPLGSDGFVSNVETLLVPFPRRFYDFFRFAC